MKVMVILLLVSIANYTLALKPNDWCSGAFLGQALKYCGQMYGATIADYIDYRNLQPARNEKIKCFRACQFSICRAFNTDGSFTDNAPQTTAFAFTRKNPYIWALAREVGRFCIKTLPSISFQYENKRHNICDKTEEFLQCMRANLPRGANFAGLF